MKFIRHYPIAHTGFSQALLPADGIHRVSVAAEERGFASIAFRRAPGAITAVVGRSGHESFDPPTVRHASDLSILNA